WNARGSPFSRVPQPFDEEAQLEWAPVWSLTQREFRYLPATYCYFPPAGAPGAQYCWADSNGNASGNTLEEAILQGFMELVERDSGGLGWYNRVRRPAVDLASFDEPYVQELPGVYRQLHRELWVLDLTGDLDIPAFVALSRRTDQPREEILFGFGAHFEPRIALLRALTELNQMLPTLAPSGERRSDEHELDDRDLQQWWQTATLANQPYLVPDDAA